MGLLVVTAATKGIIDYFHFIEPSYFWLITSFLFIVAVLSYLALIFLGNKNPENFIKIVLGSMVVKLIIYIVLVAIIILLDKENANANAVLFLTLYLVYTMLEVGVIFRKMSTSN